MNKKLLAQKIKELDTLTPDERNALLELLNTRKKYGLVWEDKPEHVEQILAQKLPVLTEVPELRIIADKAPLASSDPQGFQNPEGLNNPKLFADTPAETNPQGLPPDHILIEGDNLHALTALTFTHEGKIDVIYIDPPYNTGNKDFVYNDRYVDREDSYRHSKWLSFMEKRLRIAKLLLKDSGVIFISIDDNENAQLKLLCNEIFGEDNFAGIFPWKKRTTKSDVPFGISQDYEYVVCYANNNFQSGIVHERNYYYTDDYPNDGWRLSDLTTQRNELERPNSAFDIINPKDGKIYKYNQHRVWAVTNDTFESYYKKGKIVFPGDYDFLKIKIPAYRVFESEDKAKALKKFGSEELTKSISTLLPKEVGMNEDGNKEMIELFGSKKFSFPKPTHLVKYFLQISRNNNAVILDFFAGSGTTLHAVMQLNADDGGTRQCILVTNNENNIAREVCYERNRRVIQGYSNSKGTQVPGLHRNTLRYYIADFTERAPSIQNKLKLTRLATDLLCIKENCYTEHTQAQNHNPAAIRLFHSPAVRMLIVYDDMHIETAVELIETLHAEQPQKPIKVYIFSASEYDHKSDFDDVADYIELCTLPDAIYRAYLNVIPKNVGIAAEPSTEPTEPDLFNA